MVHGREDLAARRRPGLGALGVPTSMESKVKRGDSKGAPPFVLFSDPACSVCIV